MVNEPVGQPVKQFGMSRFGSHAAEVIGRGDKSLAEMHLPNAIDDHAAVSVLLSLATQRANASRLPNVGCPMVFHAVGSTELFGPCMPLSTPGVTASSGEVSEPPERMDTGDASPWRYWQVALAIRLFVLRSSYASTCWRQVTLLASKRCGAVFNLDAQ